MYAEFECLLEPIRDESRVQEHTMHSAAYYLNCAFGDTLSEFAIKCGADCIEWFINRLLEIAKVVNSYSTNIVPMNPLTPDEKRGFHKAQNVMFATNPSLALTSNIVIIVIYWQVSWCRA